MPRINRKDFLITLKRKGDIIDLLDGLFQGIFRLRLEDTKRLFDTLTDEEVIFLQRSFQTFAEGVFIKLCHFIQIYLQSMLLGLF